jgi:hypothetical protein
MKEVTAFVCDFCPRKKRYASRTTAIAHELSCFYNPARQACATCVHFNFVPYYHEHDTGYSEGGPECGKNMLATLDEFTTSELRADCDGWERKETDTVPIKQVRA